MKSPVFEILYTSKKSKARVGRIHTAHGIIDTPNFVAVGTNGTLKALDNKLAHETGLQLMFCNTYHLLIQPGKKVIQKSGGIHQFINRDFPIITDSGGFQVFSLAYGSVANELKSRGKKTEKKSVLKINEEGVLFRSYRDGKKILLTPENSVEFQKILNSDIIIPLDELPPYHIDKKKLMDSFERTHRWEKRSFETHRKNPQNQAMYAVVHGGMEKELRKKSCELLSKLDFDGYAIGGSLGKTKEDLFEVLGYCMDYLPFEKPVHLLGIGDFQSIEKSLCFGIDTMDSSYPTKAARHALLFTKKENIKITRAEHKEEFFPIDVHCECFTCLHYTRAYLHHLFKANELVAYTLATIHNLKFMMQLMKSYREKILQGIL